MLILIIYDVFTQKKDGQKRLNNVAKKCQVYGQRVQNSVFECNIDWTQFIKLQNDLKKIIDDTQDSLRFYNLGNSYKEKIIHIGVKMNISMDEDIII